MFTRHLRFKPITHIPHPVNYNCLFSFFLVFYALIVRNTTKDFRIVAIDKKGKEVIQ